MFGLAALLAAAAAAAAAAYMWFRSRRRQSDEDGKPNNSPPPSNQDPLDDGSQDEKDQRKSVGDLLQDLLRDVRDGKINLDFLSDKKGGNEAGDQNARLPRKYDPIADLWKEIRTIAKGLQFFERKIARMKKVGEEVVRTNVPTGDIEIKPLQSFSEIPKVLNSQMASDDDIFYPMVAGGQLLVQQPIEYQGVYKERYIRQRKTLRVLVDVSGSMKGDRIAWARLLLTLLVEKARKAFADYFLTTFTKVPGQPIKADPTETASFKEVLDYIEHSIRADGGTDISAALLNELNLIEQENKEEKMEQSAQIVLITDGNDKIDARSIQKRMEALKVELHTVVLGQRHDGLKSISKKYYYLDIAEM